MESDQINTSPKNEYNFSDNKLFGLIMGGFFLVLFGLNIPVLYLIIASVCPVIAMIFSYKGKKWIYLGCAIALECMAVITFLTMVKIL